MRKVNSDVKDKQPYRNSHGREIGARTDGDRKRMEFALPHHNNPEGVFVASDWLPSVSMVNRNYSVGMEPASAAICCGRKLI
ncbi:hypothetical protein TNCV_4038971 [Trichonephila clavipes]|nr:hypothetical protein TNCV_4038971 [Trichonephila clavipes]